MKKTAFLPALATILAFTVGSAIAIPSTISGGYAQSDLQSVVNKVNGFNLKYRYEFDNSSLGVISSLTYSEKDRNRSRAYNKAQYYGLTAGPVYCINGWVNIYGVIGVRYAKVQFGEIPSTRSNSDYGFSYGAGFQFNLTENVALDFSYEQSCIRSVDIGTWIVGAGYRF